MAMVAFSLRLLISLWALSSWPAYAALTQQIPATLKSLLSESRDVNAVLITNQPAPLRHIALKEAALSYGARSGLARRSYEIAQVLSQNERWLDMIYNFNALLLAKNVMPPILSETQSTLNQPASNLLRVADAVYRIERQAQFVTTPMHWQDYLMRNSYDQTEQPALVLQPKTKNEKMLWQQALQEGWELGVQQAEQIFQQSLAQLERDYQGMILYHSLRARQMISAPYVAEASLGVTGGSDALQLNDRLLRITAQPAFTTDTVKWKPRLIPKG